jgi:hypothetical protein
LCALRGRSAAIRRCRVPGRGESPQKSPPIASLCAVPKNGAAPFPCGPISGGSAIRPLEPRERGPYNPLSITAWVTTASIDDTGDSCPTQPSPSKYLRTMASAVRVASACVVSVGFGPPRPLASAELSATNSAAPPALWYQPRAPRWPVAPPRRCQAPSAPESRDGMSVGPTCLPPGECRSVHLTGRTVTEVAETVGRYETTGRKRAIRVRTLSAQRGSADGAILGHALNPEL